MSQLAENLIKEWWARPLPKVIPREVDLLNFHNLPVKKIVSIVGFRRSGKTYTLLDLAAKIGQKNCVYINFEDERIPQKINLLTDITDSLTELSGKKSFTLLFDEIQNIPGWETWARRIAETTNHKLFITGSSSRLASSDLPTNLRGRSLTVEIKPLNFREFLKFKNTDFSSLPKPELLNLTREYITYGGFPEIVLVEEGKKLLIIDEYYKTFLTKDVIERHKIRNSETLVSLIKLLLNSSYYTASKLTGDLKSAGFDAGKATTTRYLSFLQESFFLKTGKLHSPSVKNRLKAAQKPYFIDNFFLSRYSTEFSQNLGRLMENTVAQNLSNFYYWRDYQGHEIDFVIQRVESTEELIQVSFVSNKSEINKRETENLAKAARILKCQNLTLITWDLDGKIEKGNFLINLISLPKWLMEFPLESK